MSYDILMTEQLTNPETERLTSSAILDAAAVHRQATYPYARALYVNEVYDTGPDPHADPDDLLVWYANNPRQSDEDMAELLRQKEAADDDLRAALGIQDPEYAEDAFHAAQVLRYRDLGPDVGIVPFADLPDNSEAACSIWDGLVTLARETDEAFYMATSPRSFTVITPMSDHQ